MPTIKLIADSGSTKTEWCLLNGNKKIIFTTQGLSPYFVTKDDFESILKQHVEPLTIKKQVAEIYFYGTGCKNPDNKKMVKKALNAVFPGAYVSVENDLLGAAKSLCGKEKGLACILGTGSNSCYFSGKRIVRNIPGIGYILGDEGSGAYFGKKVIQHFLYDIFDDDLKSRFDAKFVTTDNEILTAVYTQPLPNRYLASFAIFLAENRGHYMIENIIEDGLDDFFCVHINNYKESKNLPVHFTGSIAFGFKDVLIQLCDKYQLQAGSILKNPLEGLIKYHST
ncbi:MAG: BadF/BadG/BcrA/BcrD ATPase family protein [Ginsengibacter sp.]